MNEKINISNYKKIWSDYLQGNLSDADETILFDFLDKNPQLYSNLDEDVSMKLEAPKITFENKKTLLAEAQIDNLLIAKLEG